MYTIAEILQMLIELLLRIKIINYENLYNSIRLKKMFKTNISAIILISIKHCFIKYPVETFIKFLPDTHENYVFQKVKHFYSRVINCK